MLLFMSLILTTRAAYRRALQLTCVSCYLPVLAACLTHADTWMSTMMLVFAIVEMLNDRQALLLILAFKEALEIMALPA